MHNVLNLIDVTKIFNVDNFKKEIVLDASLSICRGEVVSFIGSSGVGKSTVLHICGLLDHEFSGEVLVCNKSCKDQKFATYVRRKNIGFIYQFHHLLSDFSVLENIMIPLILNGYDKKSAKSASMHLLNFMSLEMFAYSAVGDLSGGEKQRIAVARGIVHRPDIVIADEPTGNLDSANAERVFSLLFEFVKINKSAMLIATHNIDLAKNADRIVTIYDKKIIDVDL